MLQLYRYLRTVVYFGIFLWPSYVIGQAIIFSSCGFFLLLLSSLWPPYEIGGPLYFCPVVTIFLSFFPRLISAAGDRMSTILPHMVWP